jgi:signal transduction histidine kinase
MADCGVRVLLVEDDEEDALLVREWLAESETVKFDVAWVRTYQAALESSERGQHDVYLVDYQLGQHSGVDLIRTLIARGGIAPVILLTGMGSRKVDMEAMQAGAADYLAKKQLGADMLERAIRYALERKRVEVALQTARDELELRVQERTAELVATNEALRVEMTERQRAEEKLRHSERLAAITTAAARLAHEIGNPLNGLATTVQILERYLGQHKHLADDMLSSTVQDLTHEMSRLQSLLQGWRALARPQQLNLQPTSLATLTAEVLRAQLPYYAERGIHLEQAFPAELPLVMADQEKLAQVLLNLCKNAIEAMPQGGALTVRGSSTKAQVALEVSDTGVGIPEGLNIFEPFTTTKEAGTGLGLAIVQQIVAAHQGTISYTSTPGEGTTFTLTLSVAAVENQSEADQPPAIALKA